MDKKKKNIGWICLIASGLIEIVWAYFLKESHGFTVLLPSLIAVFFLCSSFLLLERAIRTFGIGMSYAVFTGIGIAGTSIIGILVLHEGVSFLKIISLIILLAGILGLRFCSGQEEEKEAGEGVDGK